MLETMASTAPWWGPYVVPLGVALIGSGVAITEAVRKISSGFGRAEARNLAAQAIKTEAEAKQLDGNRSADFERVLNERTFRNMDMLEEQVKHLLKLVTAQTVEMHEMKQEIVELRRALDARTLELNTFRLRKDASEDINLQMNSNEA